VRCCCAGDERGWAVGVEVRAFHAASSAVVVDDDDDVGELRAAHASGGAAA